MSTDDYAAVARHHHRWGASPVTIFLLLLATAQSAEERSQCPAPTTTSIQQRSASSPPHSESQVEHEEASEVEILSTRLLQLSLSAPNRSAPTQAPAVELGSVCFADGDCCPASPSGAPCVSFCQEGHEIRRGSAAGWGVKGGCRRKWKGFCKEDEACGAGSICKRDAGDLFGTCFRDTICDTMSCGRGKCRQGVCTCDYGVTGDRCDRSLEAFAFLFYGNHSSNLVSVRVLVKSLKAGGAPQDIIAIVPKNLVHGTPVEFLRALEGDGIKIFYSEPIAMPYSMDVDPIIHQRWSGVMNKFAVWQMTNYSQVALLDTDMVFGWDSENPENLFAECSAALCAVRDGDSRFMNAGVMVVIPSKRRLAHILQVLHNEHHHFAMPEQQFLTRYCETSSYRMQLQFLAAKWNSCVGGGMLYNTGWESTGYNVLHSCSWTAKPHNMKMCFPGACDEHEELHTVLVWQFFHMQVDPCIRHTDSTECSATGFDTCTWCGHYCSDSRVPCDAELFEQTYAVEEGHRLADMHALDGLKEGSNLHALESHETLWTDLPRGSWVWPQVAMYQILVDRFATHLEGLEGKVSEGAEEQPAPPRCSKLDDYCGGSIEGIQRKLEYLLALGVDGVVLSPLVQQMPGGYHGYWPKDLDAVNPHFGSKDDVRKLVVGLHERGAKVIVDVNMNHAGGPGLDANNASDMSQLRPFNETRFYHRDRCALMNNEDYDRGERFVQRCRLYGLPDYDHENPEVWEGLMSWLRRHIDTYGFDAIRVDAARHILRSFLENIPETGAPIPAFLEVVSGDMGYLEQFAFGDYNAVYNYPLYYLLRDIFTPASSGKRKAMSELAEFMKSPFGSASGRLMLNFLDNNDLPRFIDQVNGDEALYHNALLCALAMEGLPVLLYGSEQNLRGVHNSSDPLKVDNWRPPLWHAGYNSSSPTFQMIEKVLWLRKRLSGMHSFRQRVIFSDHQVIAFSRGPLIFIATSSGQSSAHSAAQRVIWNNGTMGFAPGWVCNILQEDPLKDCFVMSNFSRIHLRGRPKVYVPSDVVREYLDFRWHLSRSEESVSEARASNPRVLAFADWQKMPRPPEIRIQPLTRTLRATRPGDVVINNPLLAWYSFPNLPPHLDRWGPPLGMPVPMDIKASVEDACFLLDAGEVDGAVFVRRGGTTYVLCPDTPGWCPDWPGQRFVPRVDEFSKSKDAEIPAGSLPVIFVTFSTWYGVHHLLVSALPGLAPFLPELKAGSMRLLIHSGKQITYPVLSLLGITGSTIFPPAEPPLQKPFHLCASKMHFDLTARPEYPNAEVIVENMHTLRKAFAAAAVPPAKARPCVGQRKSILLLSRGNSSRTLRNEAELIAELQTLGLPVEVVVPGPSEFQRMLSLLATAEVIVGPHGANLANIIFAPPGAKVVEIVPQVPYRMENHQFWDLSGALNFTYAPVGQRVHPDEIDPELAKTPMTQDKAVKSFTVDVQKVRAQVAALL